MLHFPLVVTIFRFKLEQACRLCSFRLAQGERIVTYTVYQVFVLCKPNSGLLMELIFQFLTLTLFHCHEQISFYRSNTSMAFPYVSASEDVNFKDSLVSGFAEACGDDLGIGNVAFHGSCSMGNANHEETAALHSVQVINNSCDMTDYETLGPVMVT